MKKMLLLILTLSLFVGAFTVSASAVGMGDEISPWYNNVSLEKTTFTIDSSGNAIISLLYRAKSTSNSAIITSKIQKNVSGVWVDVDINQANNQWVDTSTSTIFTNTHTTQLTSRGTYRAVVVYEISGNGGAPDVIERIIEKTY